MTLASASKQKIDSLSLTELRAEALKEGGSSYQGEKYDYLLSRLAQLQDEKRDSQHEDILITEKQKIGIAEEANKISKKANAYAKIAIWASVLALIVSIWNFALNFTENKNAESQTSAASSIIKSQ